MVSFSCENCGDVLTKKKLDAHRGRCHGASFTCLDCMVHFHGTDYRSHTSCMSEAQKYQGALYKEKPAKNKNQTRRSIADQPHNNNTDNSALVPRRAYVEDVPEEADAPPSAPSPPPNPPWAKPGPVNVFDFLVAEKSPNVSQLSFASPKEQMAMKRGAPPLFTANSKKESKDKAAESQEHAKSTRQYVEEGFSYGTEPIGPSPNPPNASLTSLEFKTPVAKSLQRSIKDKDRPSHSRQDSGNMSDRKRKRGHVDPLDLSATNGNNQESVRFELEGDMTMPDAPHTTKRTPQTLNHSGLTGGLNRLLSDSAFPPSPDYSDEKERVPGRTDPTSPLKRSKHTKENDSNGLGISIKGRAGRIMSLMGVAGTPVTSSSVNPERALVRTRQRASSSESGQRSGDNGHDRDHDRDHDRERRPRKHHRVHHVSSHGTSSARTHHRSSRRHASNSTTNEPSSSRKLKAIEYRYPSDSNSDSDSDYDPSKGGKPTSSSQQVVRYNSETAALTSQTRSEHFLSFVNKGPESEKGLSVNKCLKRWHRENVSSTSKSSSSRISKETKIEEEKELWRGLRLKRNDRGEVVVFF